MPRLWEQLCDDGKLADVLARGDSKGDSKDSFGATALMQAVWGNHNSIVKLLLNQPAVDVNVKSNYGSTALHWAALCNNAQGARMLLLT